MVIARSVGMFRGEAGEERLEDLHGLGCGDGFAPQPLQHDALEHGDDRPRCAARLNGCGRSQPRFWPRRSISVIKAIGCRIPLATWSRITSSRSDSAQSCRPTRRALLSASFYKSPRKARATARKPCNGSSVSPPAANSVLSRP